jgi:hypothetical protein
LSDRNLTIIPVENTMNAGIHNWLALAEMVHIFPV